LNPYQYFCDNLESRNGDIREFKVRGPVGSHLDNLSVRFVNTKKARLFIYWRLMYECGKTPA